MTERLTALLRQEAGDLDVPSPATHDVLARGRGLRRRRRAAGAAAGVAVLVVAAGTAFLATGVGDQDARGIDPAAPVAPAPVVFGTGSEVHLDDVVVEVPDTVHSFHYVADGVLVRSNPNGGASDGSGPESLTLVRFDGTTVDLGTIPEGVGPATDPARDVYVLAEKRGAGFVAVVRDAATGQTEDEVALPDLPKSFWEVPPLALDGETLFVGYRNETAAVDLDSGDTRIVDGLAGGIPEIYGGHAILGEGELRVLDTTSGEVVLTVDAGEFAWGSLSPDGRYLRTDPEPDVVDGELVTPPVEVYDVSDGSALELPSGEGYGWGWTSDGDLFRLEGGSVFRCEPDSGDCREVGPAPDGDIRYAGSLYES